MKPRHSGLTNNFDLCLLALHLLYFVLLLWVYTTYVVVIYGYAGFHDAFNLNKAIFSPCVILAAFASLRNNGLPSYFFLNVIIALTVTPSLVIFSGSNLPVSFIAVTWIAFELLALAAILFRLRRIQAKHINTNALLYWLAGLSLLFIASIFAFGGGKFINFDPLLVYDFRRDAAANLPAIFGYLMPNFSQTIVPIGIVLSLLYKKWILLLVFVFCSVMIFALASQKAPLLIPIIVMFIYWFSRHPKALHFTLSALIGIVLVGGLDFYLSQSGVGGFTGLFGGMLVRRSILVPCLLNWSYYDFFSVHPYVYWAESKFTLGLVDSAYDVGIAELIGREVFGKVMHANTGWIGSGMANAGYFGIALYSVLIGLFLSLLDAYAKKLGPSLVSALFLLSVIIATTGTDFTSMLLTHGLLVLMIIVILLRPDFRQSPCALPVNMKW
jgi:oligosaccharide repeat unit polymerase